MKSNQPAQTHVISKFENSKQLIHELKSCTPADVHKHAVAIIKSYIFLEKSEQKEIVETLYEWAEKNASRKPLLYSYAKLLVAFSVYYREQYDAALPLLTETQNLFVEQNDLNGAAVCTLLMGSIYRTLGNVDLALKSLWAAHEQLQKAGAFDFFLMACSVTMGGMYFEMKHYEESIPLFQSTLELAEKRESFYWVPYSLHGLGKVNLMQKKYPEAKECFEKAMEVAEKNNHPLSVCNSLSELGNYFFAVHDYNEAEQFHERSLALREQHQFIGGAITSCIRLAEIYMKQSKPDEALAVLDKGLKLAERIKVKLKMYQIHLLFSEIYQSKNDPEKSLHHYKLYHQIHDEVEREDSARKIKNAQLVFAAEQTKKENIIIKKQKEEIERKNIELQETIDELTRAKIGKKARAFTLVIAIVLFILDDFILHSALTILPANNYFISLIIKMVIIFSLSPINKATERYLLRRLVKKEKKEVLV